MSTLIGSSVARARSRPSGPLGALVLAGILLQGCDNAYEHVSQGAWTAVGRNEPPTSGHNGDFDVAVLAHGTGREVHAGELVHVRVRVGRATDSRLVAEPVVHDAWLWSGASPSDAPIADYSTWAELGSPRLRATLVGKSVGDRYSVQLAPNAEASSHRIPLYGLAEYSSLEPPFRASLSPVLEIDKSFTEIEILDACAGTLQRRTATLTQWGKTFNLMDSSHPTSRSGTLGWVALEGDCAPPIGKVRFEVGPLYAKQHELFDWENSYRRASFLDSGLGLVLRLAIGAASFALAFRWQVRKDSRRRSPAA